MPAERVGGTPGGFPMRNPTGFRRLYPRRPGVAAAALEEQCAATEAAPAIGGAEGGLGWEMRIDEPPSEWMRRRTL